MVADEACLVADHAFHVVLYVIDSAETTKVFYSVPQRKASRMEDSYLNGCFLRRGRRSLGCSSDVHYRMLSFRDQRTSLV